TKGYAEYKTEIHTAIDDLDFMNDVDAVTKKDELEAMLIDCDAVMILGKRYQELLEEEAEKCTDPVRKAELDRKARSWPSRQPPSAAGWRYDPA
ncbi:MAG: hypothetical protein IJO15_09305, partial [Clostridia bacterium]|nr:hypothetical protein [Clostridia bacterium]